MTIRTIQAEALRDSPRGELMISRALVTTIRILEQMPGDQRPISEIFDMKLLAEELYPQQLELERMTGEEADEWWTPIAVAKGKLGSL